MALALFVHRFLQMLSVPLMPQNPPVSREPQNNDASTRPPVWHTDQSQVAAGAGATVPVGDQVPSFAYDLGAGRTNTLDKLQKRIEFDHAYIRHWSLGFDLKIIFLTLFKGFIDDNAY